MNQNVNPIFDTNAQKLTLLFYLLVLNNSIEHHTSVIIQLLLEKNHPHFRDDLGFRVLGFRIWDLGFKVWGLGFWGLRFGV